jgi:hypothetical protein
VPGALFQTRWVASRAHFVGVEDALSVGDIKLPPVPGAADDLPFPRPRVFTHALGRWGVARYLPQAKGGVLVRAEV